MNKFNNHFVQFAQLRINHEKVQQQTWSMFPYPDFVYKTEFLKKMKHKYQISREILKAYGNTILLNLKYDPKILLSP